MPSTPALLHLLKPSMKASGGTGALVANTSKDAMPPRHRLSSTERPLHFGSKGGDGNVKDEAVVVDLDSLFRSTFQADQAIRTSEIIPIEQLFQKIMKDPSPVIAPHQRLYRAIMKEGQGAPKDILGKTVPTYKAFTNVLGGVEEAHQELMDLLSDGLDGNEKGRRAIVLLGGPGSGKTETVNILKRLLINSTKTINPIYILKWENLPSNILKLSEGEGAEDIDPKLSNPLLLYPLETRQHIQDSLNQKFQKKLGFPIFSLTEEELSGRSGKIRDLLVAKYQKEVKKEHQDWDESAVLLEATNRVIKNHARAQRVVFREDVGIGYVEGKDANHFDPTVISGDVHPAGEARYGSAQDPRAFDYGRSDIIKGQGGLVHFDEMLKTKDTHLNSLLQIAQEGRAKGVAGIREKICTVLLGTSNLREYVNLRKKDSNGPLFERIVVVKFRYPRNKNDELAIYKNSFLPQAKQQHIYVAPHALETAALFSVMTRLTVPNGEKKEILPVKADLYAGEFGKYHDVPMATVAKWKSSGETNYEDESKEEGFVGISTRLMRDFLTGLKHSQFIGEPGSERTLDGFAMVKALRYELENNGLFKLSNAKQREEYDQILNLAQERLEEAVSEDVKAVIESDEEQLHAAYDNYTNRVTAWADLNLNSASFVSVNERGLKETLAQAVTEMEKIEKECGLMTAEARENHRYALAAKIAQNKINKRPNSLEDNPKLKKAILTVLTRSLQMGIPTEALKAANPDEKQKAHQDRFYTLMAKKGYNRTAAYNALECYERIANRH
jgi:serine protein kinase